VPSGRRYRVTFEAVESALRQSPRSPAGVIRLDEGAPLAKRTAARLERAFRSEERAGLMLAALVRTAILLFATLYFALSSSLTGLPYFSLIGSILGLSLLGLVQFEVLRRDLGAPWAKYVFLAIDCAYLAIMFSADLGQLDTHVPPAYIIREGS